MKCAKDIITKEGFTKLYAGSLPAVVANVAENSVLFLCYGQCGQLVARVCGSSTKVGNFKLNFGKIIKALKHWRKFVFNQVLFKTVSQGCQCFQ